MFKYRVPDEIVRKLNKMEPPIPEFKDYGFSYYNANHIDRLNEEAFQAGYKQAVKELKQYFGIKGNGVHTK